MLKKTALIIIAAALLSVVILGNATASPSGQLSSDLAPFDLVLAVFDDANDRGLLTDTLNEALADVFIEYLIIPGTGETAAQIRERLTEEDQSTLGFLQAVLTDANDRDLLSDTLNEALSDLIIEYLIAPETGETTAQVRERLATQPTHTLTPTITLTPTPTPTATPTLTSQNRDFSTQNTPPTATPTPTPTATPTPEEVSNTLPAGAPTISGVARVGETLTVDTSGISDADGMQNAVFSYTWSASDYFRATGRVTSYVVQSDDLGKRIEVTVSFQDDRGNWEFVDSAETDVVVAAQ